MASSPQIILQNVSFQLPNSAVAFQQFNVVFGRKKYGLVGKNGAGKSTLLQLLIGQYLPDSGVIHKTGRVLKMAQQTDVQTCSIAKVLGAERILVALKSVQSGSVCPEDFETIGDHWDIEARIASILNEIGLSGLDLYRKFNQLSGGQQTKILWASTQLFASDFVLLDEPSNHLDAKTRATLYSQIASSSQGMIIASHDRRLLNQCDVIVELEHNSLQFYTGNYDHFKQQKAQNQQAMQHQLAVSKFALESKKKSVQQRLEKHQRSQSRGKSEKHRQIQSKGQYNKIELNSKKGRSEKTNRRIKGQAERKLDEVNQALTKVESQIITDKTLSFQVDNANHNPYKLLLQIEGLSFSYANGIKVFEDYYFQLFGADRVAIVGSNGSGKSTLLKLITETLNPDEGCIDYGTKHIAYLDQQMRLLNDQLNLLDNFLQLHLEMSKQQAYAVLAAAKFRSHDAHKLAGELSGGERLRACLAMILLGEHVPELIILDEPTNHLDIESIEYLEQTLSDYAGALLVVSHNNTFLEKIGINRHEYL